MRYLFLAIIISAAASCASVVERECAVRFVEGGERYQRCVDTASVRPAPPKLPGNRNTLVVAPNTNRRVLFVE